MGLTPYEKLVPLKELEKKIELMTEVKLDVWSTTKKDTKIYRLRLSTKQITNPDDLNIFIYETLDKNEVIAILAKYDDIVVKYKVDQYFDTYYEKNLKRNMNSIEVKEYLNTLPRRKLTSYEVIEEEGN